MNNKKSEIQNQGVEAWEKAGCIGTLAMSTGMGKTFCFFKAVLRNCHLGDKILFLAETRQREIDLFVDLKKFDKLYKTKLSKYNIQFDCYQSAYKWQDTKWDFACLDEVHDFLSPVYSKFYFNNKIEKILGLSATVDRSTKYTIDDKEFTKGDLLDQIAPVVFSYNLDNAVDDETTKKLNVFVIYHQLDQTHKTVKAGTKTAPFLTTEKAAYDYWDKEFKKSLFLSEGTSKTFRIRNTSAARAKILYDLPSKVESIKELITHLKGQSIIFGNSLEALHKITDDILDGKKSDKTNTLIRSNFDNKKIAVIGSFKLLKQGANLKQVDNTIIMSYYGKEKDMIQRLGRQRDDGSTGNVFVYLTIGTQEQKWYDASMENITRYNMIYCNGTKDTIKKYSEILAKG